MPEISPPKYVKNVLKTLDSHGYSSCIVGGCVRDAIRGIEPHDWDVATVALPEQVFALFPNSIPTGIKHGTVTVRSEDQFVEVTTFRSESGYADHRHPDSVNFVGDLKTDLSRRDFTINAIAMTSDGEIIDPYHGIDDILSRIIRCVGAPEKRFEEDALRMFRAFRFSARLGFSIEQNTYEAIQENARLARKLSAERVRDEIEKMLLTGTPEILYQVISCGLADRFLAKHLDSDDAMIRISTLSRDALARWAMFCTILLEDGCICDPEQFLSALRLDRRTIRCCKECCEILKQSPPEDVVGWKQLMRKYGPDTIECASKCSDAMHLEKPYCVDLVKKIVESRECFSIQGLAVNGNDLREIGYQGINIGIELNALLDMVIDFPEKNERELLLATALEDKGIRNGFF